VWVIYFEAYSPSLRHVEAQQNLLLELYISETLTPIIRQPKLCLKPGHYNEVALLQVAQGSVEKQIVGPI